MLRSIAARVRQGFRTAAWPRVEATVPSRYRGLPVIREGACSSGCEQCSEVCPTGAVRAEQHGAALDMGSCLFCGECASACPDGRIEFSRQYRLAASKRDELVVRAEQTADAGRALNEAAHRLFGRSLKLRQVSAGGCNACEADVNVLGTIGFDMGQFGVEFVASPRHADGLLVTGPVTANMRLALEKTWAAVPSPKIVIAVGACAISGGPYAGSPQCVGGAGEVVPVDLFVPGCPPHPMSVLDGMLRMIGRIEDRGRAGR